MIIFLLPRKSYLTTLFLQLALNEEPDHHNINENSNSSSSAANTQEQQHADLQDSFGESFDDEEGETDRLLYSGQQQHRHAAEDEEDEEDEYNHHNTIIHIPTQTQTQTQTRSSGPAVLPVSTDGVFANMSAKPESESNKLDETPPVRK